MFDVSQRGSLSIVRRGCKEGGKGPGRAMPERKNGYRVAWSGGAHGLFQGG